ncbi:SPOR domain-containing protein [Sunxiuqinia elliptica]|uniref:Sporulation related domain-containing protein n=1 Tax=Sunxiuqinia elliptica TaxID=655355 RepID=A0A1I2ASV1_9BACT|nr:SPOR domain-containing protein [Sunxiuqinia elliptica]SFE47075.1 Sporulation related domain-containing protein [Sunxiuqinia elliptica]
MKKIMMAVLALGLLSSSCKVFQKVKKEDKPATETVQDDTQTKVFSVPSTQTEVREAPSSDRMYEQAEKTEKPVRIQSETFTFAQKEDQAKNENNSYFVIIGSFSSNANANRYKQELIPQGFNPIVLHSETGYYRVCVNSFTDEFEARKRVYQIRNDFPQYADTWLLIKK